MKKAINKEIMDKLIENGWFERVLEPRVYLSEKGKARFGSIEGFSEQIFADPGLLSELLPQ